MKKIILHLLLFISILFESNAQSPVHLRKIGSYSTNVFNQGGAEISAYDEKSKRLFLVNGGTGDVDVLDISNPSNPTLFTSIDMAPWGIGANSIAVNNGIIVAAVENYNKQANGFAVFFNNQGQYLKHVTVGALPDMITFTPNGKNILVANEGEPNDAYTVDPLGTVSIIEYPNIQGVKQSKVYTLDFSAYNNVAFPSSIKINGPGSTVAQDFEPEFIGVSKDSKTAYVTLQENNAIAKIDIDHKNIEAIFPLGFQDHNVQGHGLDASDQNLGIVDIKTWPVRGLFQPDAVTTFKTNDGEFIVTANEGDVREYTGFAEAKRVSTLTLDPVAFPNAATLKNNNNLGRLNVTKSLGDDGTDGDYESLYSFGGRSFSIRDEDGNLIWDSGDLLEQKTNLLFPINFNSSNTNNTKKNRSDDKGPEPEGLTVGKILDSTYLFLGLERMGGIMVFNITDVYNPVFLEYINPRDFNTVPALNAGGDLGPEGMLFIQDKDSPNDKNLLIVSNEISGTISIYETDWLCGKKEIFICLNGTSLCIKENMLNNYLQNGAVIGDCSGLRIARAVGESPFIWKVEFNMFNRSIELEWENSNESQAVVTLIDMAGRTLYSKEVATTDNSLSVPAFQLPTGLFFVRLTGKNFDETRKLIIN